MSVETVQFFSLARLPPSRGLDGRDANFVYKMSSFKSSETFGRNRVGQTDLFRTINSYQ